MGGRPTRRRIPATPSTCTTPVPWPTRISRRRSGTGDLAVTRSVTSSRTSPPTDRPRRCNPLCIGPVPGRRVTMTASTSTPHTLGLIASIAWYHSLTGDSPVRRRRDGAARLGLRCQRLGQPASWSAKARPTPGVCSTRSPTCSGSTDGRAPIAVGAVVNGPNGTSVFEDGLDDYLDGMRHCPPDGADIYARFTGHGGRYVDDVRSWQTSEPADDFTALGLYALTLSAAGARPLRARAVARCRSSWHSLLTHVVIGTACGNTGAATAERPLRAAMTISYQTVPLCYVTIRFRCRNRPMSAALRPMRGSSRGIRCAPKQTFLGSLEKVST